MAMRGANSQPQIASPRVRVVKPEERKSYEQKIKNITKGTEELFQIYRD